MDIDRDVLGIVGIVILIGFAVFFFQGNITGQISDRDASIDAENELSGTLKLNGSTTVYPVVVKAAEVFMQKHPRVNIVVDQSSTGEGIERFLKVGDLDIVDGTRPPKDKEYEEAWKQGRDLYITVVSNDAVVVVVNKDNPLKDISTEQLKKIFYTGEITDWSQVTDGKKTGKINVYGTDPKISGTAELFTQKIKDKGTFVEGYKILHPTPLVVPTIASDPNGIAYTPLKWVDDSVVLLSVDGVTAKTDTILDTSYKLARKMIVMTDGPPEGITREFINFVLSSEGQKIVEEEGFIPIG